MLASTKRPHSVPYHAHLDVFQEELLDCRVKIGVLSETATFDKISLVGNICQSSLLPQVYVNLRILIDYPTTINEQVVLNDICFPEFSPTCSLVDKEITANLSSSDHSLRAPKRYHFEEQQSSRSCWN